MYTLDILKEQYLDIPEDIWNMLNNVDTFTYNHSIRVCEMCQTVEKELQLPNRNLSKTGLLHDIGKYYISQKILEKRGQLSLSERNFINAHAFLSYDTLMQFHLPKEICQLALYHHSTSPNLFGKKLPVCKDAEMKTLARIIKTIDIFEAVTSDRSYHRGVLASSAAKYFDDIDHDKKVLNILVNDSKWNRN